MPFPFSIRYHRQLRTKITNDHLEPALVYLKKEIIERRADNVIISNNEVSYSGSTSYFRGSLFGDLNGRFILMEKDGSSYLVYECHLSRLFIITGAMSTIFGLFGIVAIHIWYLGIIAFLWLCGLNWITCILRHDSLATDVAIGIDDLFGSNEHSYHSDEERTEDAEKLKGWM